jgi:hypothetical protein
MAPILLGLAGFGVVALFLGLFARGGPREPASTRRTPTFGRDRLIGMTQELLANMGLRMQGVELREKDSADLIAVDPRPGVGQTLYVRVVSTRAPVETDEVQGALDRLKGDGLHKALLISDSGFSDEAISAALETAVELMDGVALQQALERPGAEPAPQLTPRHA